MRGRIAKETTTGTITVIGKIKVGEKTDKGYPRSLDYFVASGNYMEHFRKAYGEKPKSLLVIFPSDDLRQVCDQRYEMRDQAGRLVAYSDGYEYALYSKEKDEYRVTSVDDRPDIHDWTASHFQATWRETLRLRFILPEVRGVIGLWQFETSGVSTSIPSIISTFDYIQQGAGTVKNIPFDLIVTMRKSQRPGSKSRFPVVQLVCNISTDNLEKIQKMRLENKFSGMLTDQTIEALGYHETEEA